MIAKKARRTMELPPNLRLPYFAYGLLQPGELAHEQIAPVVQRRRASVRGNLRVRDGIPLLSLEGSEHVSGWAMLLPPAAYEAIAAFEPSAFYRWATTRTTDGQEVNILVGATTKGSVVMDADSWSGIQDPVFTHGLKVVDAVARADGSEPFTSTRPESVEWDRFFRLQAAYLLLWSAIERYAALTYGPEESPNSKLKALGGDPRFAEALRSIVVRTDRVYESWSRDSAVLDPGSPQRSVRYFYIVRSNLSHRGKGAWADAERVRLALRDLSRIFSRVMDAARHRAAEANS